jgi:hypothetical protein
MSPEQKLTRDKGGALCMHAVLFSLSVFSLADASQRTSRLTALIAWKRR